MGWNQKARIRAFDIAAASVADNLDWDKVCDRVDDILGDETVSIEPAVLHFTPETGYVSLTPEPTAYKSAAVRNLQPGELVQPGDTIHLHFHTPVEADLSSIGDIPSATIEIRGLGGDTGERRDAVGEKLQEQARADSLRTEYSGGFEDGYEACRHQMLKVVSEFEAADYRGPFPLSRLHNFLGFLSVTKATETFRNFVQSFSYEESQHFPVSDIKTNDSGTIHTGLAKLPEESETLSNTFPGRGTPVTEDELIEALKRERRQSTVYRESHDHAFGH